MNVIKDNCEVEIEFTLKTSEGNIVDSSKEEGPLKYIHGQKKISPELEKALTGRKQGEKFKLKVEPADAYGERSENLLQFAKKEQFGEDFQKISVGMPLELENSKGELVLAVAKEIRNDGIVIDANHPLAGQTLTFDIKVLSVREISEK